MHPSKAISPQHLSQPPHSPNIEKKTVAPFSSLQSSTMFPTLSIVFKSEIFLAVSALAFSFAFAGQVS
jgi:hypothetical protein